MAIKLPKTHLALSPMSPLTELQVCTSTPCFSTSALETQTFSCVHSDCFTNWAGSPPITLGLLTQLAVFRRESLADGNAMLQWQMLGHPSETGAYGKMLPLRYWGCLCLEKKKRLDYSGTGFPCLLLHPPDIDERIPPASDCELSGFMFFSL